MSTFFLIKVCYPQVITESVRLTDEAQLEQQTDEKGDLFLWFKHQASQGVVSAQVILHGVYGRLGAKRSYLPLIRVAGMTL